MKSVQKVTSHEKETFIEATRYKKCSTWHNDSSVPFKAESLGPHTILPIAISCPTLFSWMSSTAWNLFPFKGDFSFGKSQKSQVSKFGMSGTWITWVTWYFAKKLCTRCGAWVDVLLWWSRQSRVAHSFGLLNHPNSFCRGMFKLNIKFDA